MIPGDQKTIKISPIRPPFPVSVSGPMPENPGLSPFSVPVEKKPNCCAVCQNTAELHLAQTLSKALKSCRFLLPVSPHLGPKKAAGMRI